MEQRTLFDSCMWIRVENIDPKEFKIYRFVLTSQETYYVSAKSLTG
jgi:hypothetical protein